MVDPLVLDLDGDGLEISPLSQGVQFDGNGDTIRTATSWVQADDGLLVLDRNGNGAIDSGRELFGDETLLADGKKAAHGFAALAELDVGGAAGASGGAGDGVFDAKDAQFGAVRIWRDANQDGISQAGELQTLADAGIASVKLSSTATDTSYGDAQLVQSGSFTRTDGSEGQAGSFILAQNNAVTTHAPIAISAAAAALPAIQGSGWVRGLQEAATLKPQLLDLFGGVQGAGSRAGFGSNISQLLLEWGNDNDYVTASEKALEEDGVGLILRNPSSEKEMAWMEVAIKASKETREAFRSNLSQEDRDLFDGMRSSMVGQLERLYAYEAFTGYTFLKWSDIEPRYEPPSSGPGTGRPVTVDTPLSQVIQEKAYGKAANMPGYRIVVIPEPISGMPHIDMLWKRLVEDATRNLMPSMRLSQYADMVQLTVSDTGVALDFSQMDAALEAASAADAQEGAALFLDIYRTYGGVFKSAGWEGGEKLRTLMQTGVGNQAIEEAFAVTGLNLVAATASRGTVNDDSYAGDAGANTFNGDAGDDFIDGGAGNDNLSGAMGDDVVLSGAGNDTLSGGDGVDTLDGGEGSDYLYGELGDDTLLGGAGVDYLYGDAGDDTLDGGAGNDILNGGMGNNTFLFGKGDGSDTIQSVNDATAGKLNVLRFKAGVAASEVRVTRSGYSLVLSIAGTTDVVTVADFFYENSPANTWNPLQEVRFEDGTVWNLEALVATTLGGTEGADTFTGTDGADNLLGLGGNDQMSGGKGNDTLDGGEGSDYLYGELGDDTLLGGAGVDYLYGDAGDDTLDGGAGNDILNGGMGNNTFLFGKGDGSDTIQSVNDATAGKLNVLRFKAGVAASEVRVTRSGYSLVLSIAGTTDVVTVADFFYENSPANTWNPLQEVRFEDGTVWNLEALVATTLGGTEGADTFTGTDGADNLLGLGGNDQMSGGKGNDTLDGGEGSDYLYGELGDDTLLGGAGVDYLYGDAGDDTLDGGAGNDILNGGMGNNTFLFGKGDGSDTIQSVNDATAGKLNVLRFKAGVAASEVRVTRSGYSLVLSIAGTTDVVTVADFFYENSPANTWNPLQEVRFEDGTVWNLEALVATTLGGTEGADTFTGTDGADNLLGLGGNDQMSGGKGNDTLDGGEGSDYLYGELGDDTLLGGAGVDYLYGDAGDDTLDGGAGNDILNGGMGNNTFLFGKGDGSDTIQSVNDATAGKLNVLRFKAGVAASEVRVTRSGYSLVLSIAGTTDVVTVADFFYENSPANTWNPLQEVRFEDGTVWNLEALVATTLGGTEGADTFTGTDGADNLLGLGGNDQMSGGKGNDTLDGGEGSDYLYGELGDDTLLGGAGVDYLYGDAGDDTLDGGAGNDILNGGMGNNTFLFGKGDGSDTIQSVNDATAGKLNVLRFKAGVAASEVRVTRSGYSLVLSIAGTTDVVTVADFFYENSPANTWNPLQEVRFEDGTVWNLAAIEGQLAAQKSNLLASAGTAEGAAKRGQAEGVESIFAESSRPYELAAETLVNTQTKPYTWDVFYQGTFKPDMLAASTDLVDALGNAWDVQATGQGVPTLESQTQQLLNAMASFAAPPGAQTRALDGTYQPLLNPIAAASLQ